MAMERISCLQLTSLLVLLCKAPSLRTEYLTTRYPFVVNPQTCSLHQRYLSADFQSSVILKVTQQDGPEMLATAACMWPAVSNHRNIEMRNQSGAAAMREAGGGSRQANLRPDRQGSGACSRGPPLQPQTTQPSLFIDFFANNEVAGQRTLFDGGHLQARAWARARPTPFPPVLLMQLLCYLPSSCLASFLSSG
jgi:hypothetical protein